MNSTALSVAALRHTPYAASVLGILQAALQAVDPGEAVHRCMKLAENQLALGERVYLLDKVNSIRIVGAGKAGYPMAKAAVEIIGARLSDSVVIVKDGHLGSVLSDYPQLCFIEASHPVPDQRGVLGTRRIQEVMKDLQPDDLVIALISGGGSALLTAPADNISLADLRKLTADLLACGATIQEINTLRKHLDLVKGGGLARMVAPAQLATLILSDVVGDPLDVIASGPTVPDPTKFVDAYAILDRYHLIDKTPPAILERIQRGLRNEIQDTPKQGDPMFEGVNNVIIGSNFRAAQAALVAAEEAGFHSLLLTTYLQGEARQAGRMLASLLRQIAATGQPLPRPACLVAGGETTVTLSPGIPGLGGRNLELALSAAIELGAIADIMLVALATDGGDGPTDAAGAVVSGETLARAKALGLEAPDFLRRNDSYHFFAALDDLLKTGPTQTNVNDLIFLFAF
jgi:glycerate 2-kinase